MIDAVVFDLGKVLVDWDPRHLLASDDGDANQLDVDELVTLLEVDEIQRQLDLGVPVAEVHARWQRSHREHRALVDRYFTHWDRTVAGVLDDTVAVLDELRGLDVGLYALSNFSGELFRRARPRLAFVDWFDGMVISGDEGVIKPDPRIYALLLERYALDAGATVFIDDRVDNIDGAIAAGMHGIVFTSADQLRTDLRALGVPVAAGPKRTTAR